MILILSTLIYVALNGVIYLMHMSESMFANVVIFVQKNSSFNKKSVQHQCHFPFRIQQTHTLGDLNASFYMYSIARQ